MQTIKNSEAKVRALAHDLRDMPGALLPILHRVQNEFGYLPKESIALVASELNLSRAEVHGVISFYHDFRQDPPADHIVEICRAEACQAVGARALQETLEQTLSTKVIIRRNCKATCSPRQNSFNNRRTRLLSYVGFDPFEQRERAKAVFECDFLTVTVQQPLGWIDLLAERDDNEDRNQSGHQPQ